MRKMDDSALAKDGRLKRMSLDELLEEPVSPEMEKISETMKNDSIGLEHYAKIVSIFLTRRKKINKLIHCLGSVDLLPYRDIGAFKKKVERRANRSRIFWSIIVISAAIVDLFISSVSTTHVLFEIVLLSAMALVFIANLRYLHWQSIHLDDYDQLIPDSLLQKITTIKKAIPDVQFFVAQLNRAPANLNDHLLEVYLPVETYDPKVENSIHPEFISWTIAHW